MIVGRLDRTMKTSSCSCDLQTVVREMRYCDRVAFWCIGLGGLSLLLALAASFFVDAPWSTLPLVLGSGSMGAGVAFTVMNYRLTQEVLSHD